MSRFDPESPDFDDGDLLKRTVIESARDDIPPPGARDQVLLALKLAPPLGVAKPRSSRWDALGNRYGQVLGLAVVVGFGVIATLSMSSGVAPSGPATVAEAAVPVVVETASDPKSAAPVEPATALVASAPAAAEAAPSNGSANTPANARSSRTAVSARDDSTLSRELARVGAARSALAGGDAVYTLKLLDAYDAEFPAGTFSVEVSVLRIEALARAGRAKEARRLGDRFLAQHPDGVLARRVATMLQTVAPRSVEPAPSPAR